MGRKSATYGGKLDPPLVALARKQHGVVALRQLLELDLTPRTVHSWAERGRLQRVHRGVYALSPVLTSKGRLMAAVLACGDDSALSHRSGAHHIGVRRTSRLLVEVSVPRGSARQRPGIQVHRQRRMETTVVDGIPCTTLAQTLLDLAEVVPPLHVRKAITRAEHLRIFDLGDVNRVLASADGRKGAPILASILADFQPVATESKLEDLFLPLCPTKPTEQYWINGYRTDFAWPAEMLIAEIDDWETHGTRTAFEKDRARLQDLTAQGWRVVMFTHRQMTRDPERVRTILRSLLLSAAA